MDKKGSILNTGNEEPDTTVTATFAGGIDTVIEREDGTFVISSEKDSTVTINKPLWTESTIVFVTTESHSTMKFEPSSSGFL